MKALHYFLLPLFFILIALGCVACEKQEETKNEAESPISTEDYRDKWCGKFWNNDLHTASEVKKIEDQDSMIVVTNVRGVNCRLKVTKGGYFDDGTSGRQYCYGYCYEDSLVYYYYEVGHFYAAYQKASCIRMKPYMK